MRNAQPVVIFTFVAVYVMKPAPHGDEIPPARVLNAVVAYKFLERRSQRYDWYSCLKREAKFNGTLSRQPKEEKTAFKHDEQRKKTVIELRPDLIHCYYRSPLARCKNTLIVLYWGTDF